MIVIHSEKGVTPDMVMPPRAQGALWLFLVRPERVRRLAAQWSLLR